MVVASEILMRASSLSN